VCNFYAERFLRDCLLTPLTGLTRARGCIWRRASRTASRQMVQVRQWRMKSAGLMASPAGQRRFVMSLLYVTEAGVWFVRSRAMEMTDDGYLNLRQLSAYSGLAARTLRHRLASGVVPYYREGNRPLVKRSDWDAYMAKRLVTGRRAPNGLRAGIPAEAL
jgi:hypothetical protein